MKQKLFLGLSILFILFTSFYKPQHTALPKTPQHVKFYNPYLYIIDNTSTSTSVVYASVNDVSSGGTPSVYGNISPSTSRIAGYSSSTDSLFIQTKIAGGTFSHVDLIDNSNNVVLDSKSYNPSNPIYHLSYGGDASVKMVVFD